MFSEKYQREKVLSRFDLDWTCIIDISLIKKDADIKTDTAGRTAVPVRGGIGYFKISRNSPAFFIAAIKTT